jgi:peptide/nickel transport system permease protein
MALPPLEAEHEAERPDADASASVPETKIHGRSPAQIAFQRLRNDKVAVICACIVLFFVLIAIFAPLLTNLWGVEVRAGDPTDDLDIMTGYGKVGPPYEPFSWSHPLGVEPNSGDDLLAEWFYGARTSLFVAAVATVTTTVIGIVVGLIAGFATGWLDRVIQFIIDVFLSFPFLLGALTLAPIVVSRFADQPDALTKAQFGALLFVLTIFGWMALARLVRGEVLSLREREFVEAARAIGVPTRSILFRELLPNLTAPIIVSISLGLPAFVTAEAGLAYLGIGVTGTPSWGQTINRAQTQFEIFPLFLWAPVIGIMALVLALNLLGDSVRDAFDPKTRR